MEAAEAFAAFEPSDLLQAGKRPARDTPRAASSLRKVEGVFKVCSVGALCDAKGRTICTVQARKLLPES